MEFSEMWNDLWTGDGAYILRRWSWLDMRTMANQKIGRWGWDFHTVRGGIMCGWIPIPIVPG